MGNVLLKNIISCKIFPESNKSIQIKSHGLVIITKSEIKDCEADQFKAQPLFISKNQADLTQYGSNPRKLCQTPNQYPYSAIGVLFMYYNKKYNGYGTAFLIADNVVLTAAHNIYDRSEKIPIKFVNLIMEPHQGGKTYRAVCAFVPRQYKQTLPQDEIRKYDFAILILESNEELARKYGKIPLSLNMRQNDKIEVYGYPADLSLKQFKKECRKLQNDKIPQDKFLFGSQDKILELTSGNIYHNVSTNSGNSGSPIMRLNFDRYEAIGIHTSTLKTKNAGVRINNEVVNRIVKWIQLFWKGKKDDERISLLDESCYQIIPWIVPDKQIDQIIYEKLIEEQCWEIDEFYETFDCPITNSIMIEPYLLRCGHCFQKQVVRILLKNTKKCPLCKMRVNFDEGIVNRIAKYANEDTLKRKQQNRVRRMQQKSRKRIEQMVKVELLQTIQQDFMDQVDDKQEISEQLVMINYGQQRVEII